MPKLMSDHDRRQPDNQRPDWFNCCHCMFWVPMQKDSVSRANKGQCWRNAPSPVTLTRAPKDKVEGLVVYPCRTGGEFCADLQLLPSLMQMQGAKMHEARKKAELAAKTPGIVVPQVIVGN